MLPTGAGKSSLACALTYAAVRRGHTALYARVPRLLAELALSRGDGRYVNAPAVLGSSSALLSFHRRYWRVVSTA